MRTIKFKVPYLNSKSYSIFESRLVIRILILLFSLIPFTVIFSQDKTNNDQNDGVLVFVTGGAEIHSSDENFNRQLSTTSKKYISHKEIIVFSSKKNTPEKTEDLSTIVKEEQLKKNKILIAKVEKHVQKFRELKEKVALDYLNDKTSNGNFSVSHRITKDFVHSNINGKDHSKTFVANGADSLEKFLGFLYVQNFIRQNSLSFTYSFSKVYSVRPPPFKV